ncbi:uncharacterized protein IL334_002583 [Kwoniella shivajii]|uniref:Uncharacterized protein n=1 Tax=Kwoniella shivajii TaxID=564305 RepID=A0ABZ1CVS5_9TREE|nr:hypothetical protein IL334_002583 [Kwoniella shivajii]
MSTSKANTQGYNPDVSESRSVEAGSVAARAVKAGWGGNESDVDVDDDAACTSWLPEKKPDCPSGSNVSKPLAASDRTTQTQSDQSTWA